MPRRSHLPPERLNINTSRYNLSTRYGPPFPAEVDDKAGVRAQAWKEWRRLRATRRNIASVGGRPISVVQKQETPKSESEISWVREINPTIVALARGSMDRETRRGAVQKVNGTATVSRPMVGMHSRRRVGSHIPLRVAITVRLRRAAWHLLSDLMCRSRHLLIRWPMYMVNGKSRSKSLSLNTLMV